MSETETTVFNELIGKTFEKVHTDDQECELFFVGEKTYKFYHEQDCCEGVSIEDICGDLSDLEGSIILRAEETGTVSKQDEDNYESVTWTFYRFETEKGCVVVRWQGESNGYYSESVDFTEVL